MPQIRSERETAAVHASGLRPAESGKIIESRGNCYQKNYIKFTDL